MYLAKVSKKLKDLMIDRGFINNITVHTDSFSLKFHDTSKSTLLKELARSGKFTHEPELSRFIAGYPNKQGTFIDAGANIGYFSALTRKHWGTDCKIIAIEPFPLNVAYINRLMESNGLEFDLVQYALWDKDDETLEFFYSVDQSSSILANSGTLLNQFEGTDGLYSSLKSRTLQVKTIRLDTLLGKYKAHGPYFLKVDCEGAEFTILKSSEAFFRSTPDIDVVVEIMINDKDKHELFNFMRNCGFDAYLITNAGLISEDRPLTLPYYHHEVNPSRPAARTCWKNHYFTKRAKSDVENMSTRIFGYVI